MLLQIAETFLGCLEVNMIQTCNDMSSPLHFKKLILIAKIFYMCNTMKLLPFLVEPGRLDVWIDFITNILDHQNPDDSPLIQQTDS